MLCSYLSQFDRENFPVSPDTIDYFMSDAFQLINNRGSHPSIIQWNLFNERDCVNQFDVARYAYSV